MATQFWELFVHHVTAKPTSTVSAELDRLAGEIARLLSSLEPTTAVEAFSALCERVAREYDQSRTVTDDPQPVPVPPEMVELANRTFNEVEILEAVRELQVGGGRTFEEAIAELEALPSGPKNAPN